MFWFAPVSTLRYDLAWSKKTAPVSSDRKSSIQNLRGSEIVFYILTSLRAFHSFKKKVRSLPFSFMSGPHLALQDYKICFARRSLL